MYKTARKQWGRISSINRIPPWKKEHHVHKVAGDILLPEWLRFWKQPLQIMPKFWLPKRQFERSMCKQFGEMKGNVSNCIYNKINLHLSYNKIHLRTYLHTSTISPMIFLIPTVVCVTPFIVFFSVFVGSSHCRFWRGWELWTHEPAMLGMNLRDETSYPAYVGITPWKINMEHNHGGLKDHFPF